MCQNNSIKHINLSFDICPLSASARKKDLHWQADFISCDDKLLKKCDKIGLRIWTGNPISFCEKEELR